MALDYRDLMARHREDSPDQAATPVFHETGKKRKYKPAKLVSRVTTRGKKGIPLRRTRTPGVYVAAEKKKNAAKPLTRKPKRGSTTDSAVEKLRKRPRSTSGTSEAKMAKGKKKKGGSRKSGRLTKAEIKKAGGIKEAWAARKRGGSSKPAARKSKPKKGGHRKTTRHAARHSGPHKGKKKGGHRKGGRKSGSARSSKTTIIKTSKSTQGVALVQLPKGAAETSRRRGKKKGGRKGGHRRRHHHIMENPLGGLELFVGGLTGVVGFVSADVLDRVLATHALTAAGTNDANGNAMYTDTPPTASTWRGNYANLYNGTAVIAPMSLARWGIGLLVPVVLFVGAHFIKSGVGRSAVQMFGFGWGMRIVGGGLVKILGSLTSKTAFGQRVFDAEIRANALYGGKAASLVQASGQGTALTNTAGSQIAPSVPTTGLGTPHTGLGDCGCMSCKARFGCGGGTATGPAAPTPTQTQVFTNPMAPWQPPSSQIPSPPQPPVAPAQPSSSTCPDGNVVIQASSVPAGVSPTYVVYKNTINPSQAPQYQTPNQPAPPGGYIVGYCVSTSQLVSPPQPPTVPAQPVATVPQAPAPIQIVSPGRIAPNGSISGLGRPNIGYIPPVVD